MSSHPASASDARHPGGHVDAPTPERRPSQVLPALVSGAIIVACTLGGCAVLAHVRSQLPGQVVTHWGVSGAPDGFTDRDHVITMLAALSCGIPLVTLALGIGLRQAGRVASIAAGTAAMLTLTVGGSVWMQRGHAAPSPRMNWWPFVLGLLAGGIVGVLTWLATRRWIDPGTEVVASSAPALALAPGARVAWTGHTRTGRMVRILAPVALLVPLITAVITASAGGWSAWVTLIPAELAIGAALSSMSCQVRIDARGVRVAGLGIVPFVRTPLDAVAGASVINDVQPMADFGGWGLRGSMTRGGGWGIITAAGPALRIHRVGRKDVCVTLDHPEVAAAALNALVSASGREPQDPESANRH